MRLNRKGFVIEGALLYLLVGAASIGIFLLTPLKNLITIPGEGSKSVQNSSYTETMEPVLENGQPVKVQLQDGSEGLIFKRTKSNNTLNEQTQPKLTLWQKIQQLGWWLIVIYVVLLFVAPTAVHALNQKVVNGVKTELANLKTDTKKIVLSVDNALGVFDTRIKAAVAAFDSSKSAAASTIDPSVLAANKAIMDTQQAVVSALTGTKQDVLDAMTMVQGQNSSTEAVVTNAQQGNL